MSCSVLGNSCKVLALALSLMAMACSTSGGGAGTPTVGGVAGAPCSTDYHNEGCNNLPGPPVQRNRMVCTAGASGATWQLKVTCGDAQVCVEQPDPAAGATAKKITSCVTIQQPAGNDTTSSGADVTSSGNDTTSSNSDINTSPKVIVACMQSGCSSQYAACMQKSDCAAILTCVSACNDGTCADACSKGTTSTSQELLALSVCGMDKGCIPKTSTGPVCGNGACESGETSSSCPVDCKTTTTPVCGNGKCEAGENVEMCPADCKSTGPVCGNGTCDSGETASSCPSDCGTTTSGFCGDLSCKSPENATSCPLDCDTKSQQMLMCAESACGSQASMCMGDKACMTAVNCFMKCGSLTPDSSCGSMCMSGLPSNTMSEVGSLLTCVQSSCSTTSPSCGNGKCESGETYSNCPVDCPPSGPVCGNGTCESGETPSSCPSDCKSTTTCGNGQCDSGETSSTCPSDCPATTGSCGDGVCATGEQSTCPKDCTNFGKSGGCAAAAAGVKGCLGCLCEQCVIFTGNPTTGQAADSYCQTTAWDATCAQECAACTGSGCTAP